MNHKRIAELQGLRDSIDAVISKHLAPMSAIDLAEAAEECIEKPLESIMRLLMSADNINNGAALISATLIREAIRKAEQKEMEKA